MMKPFPTAFVPVVIKRPNGHGATVLVDDAIRYRIRQLGSLWTVQPTIGAGAAWERRTRDEAIESILQREWEV